MCSRRPSLAAVASLLFLSSGCVRAVVAEGTLHALLGGHATDPEPLLHQPHA